MANLLPDQLRLMAANLPDTEAFRDVTGGDTLTFAQWEAASNRLARWFVARGIEVGDRIALVVPPDEASRFLVAYAAIHKAGAVAVPTSTRLVAPEVAAVLGHAGATIAVCGAGSAATLAQAMGDLAELRTVVTTAPLDTFAEGVAVGFDEADDADDSAFQVPVASADMADIMYTSGTTGRPKGVVVRHGNIALMGNGLPRWSGAGWLHASPMFTFAGIASAYNPMKLGMRHLYLPRFDVDAWFDAVERERPAAVFLVPAMAELLIASPRWVGADLSSITLCHVGSAPLAPATFAALRSRLERAMVSNSWGMTEAGPAYCHMPPEEQDRRIGSVGKPMPPVTFRIVGPDGAVLPANEVGELHVSNPGTSASTSTTPRRPPGHGATVGCAPATWPASTTTGSCTWWVATRTSSFAAATTCTRPISRRCSTSTRRCRRPPSPVSPTPCWVRTSAPGSWRCRGRRSTPRRCTRGARSA